MLFAFFLQRKLRVTDAFGKTAEFRCCQRAGLATGGRDTLARCVPVCIEILSSRIQSSSRIEFVRQPYRADMHAMKLAIFRSDSRAMDGRFGCNDSSTGNINAAMIKPA